MQLVERFNRVWSGYARHVAERNPDHRVAVRFAVPHDSLVVLRERIPGVRFESEAGAVPGDVPLATWSMPIESYVALIDVLGNDLLDLLRSSTQDASS